MSDSESLFESEPNVFVGESSNDLFCSNSEAVRLSMSRAKKIPMSRYSVKAQAPLILTTLGRGS